MPSPLRLIGTFAEMTLYMTTKAITDEGPGVGREIKKFLELKADLVEKHDPNMFSYLKALRLEEHDLLAPINFPNLYKVANMHKRKVDPMFRDYKSTKEPLSRIPEYDIDTALVKAPIKTVLAARDAEGPPNRI